jgi:hypothetical protein
MRYNSAMKTKKSFKNIFTPIAKKSSSLQDDKHDHAILNLGFRTTLKTMNAIKSRAHGLYVLLSILRAASIAGIVTALWNDVSPANPSLHILTGLVTFAAIVRFSSLGRTHNISSSAMLVALDIQHPTTLTSPFAAAASPSSSPEWEPRLLREERKLRAWEGRRLTTLAGSLLVPTLTAILLIYKAPLNLSSAINDAKNVIIALNGGVTLDVVDGAAPSKLKESPNPATYTLSSSSVSVIDLIPSNMLRINLVRVTSSQSPPIIMLQGAPGSAPLTIQMSPANSSPQPGNIWTAEFSASEISDLIIPDISAQPLAHLNVIDLPIPKVQLSIQSQNVDPWPDHVLLPLAVRVSSVHPLDKIYLKITSKGKTTQESVLNITGTLTEVSTTYNLNLQPWMEEDFMEFDIVAEALDRADPLPLTGQSPPIHLKVASAYGRYKNSLATLKQVKTIIDDSRGSSRPQPLPPAAVAAMAKAMTQSQDTPFFDGLDRAELERLQLAIIEAAKDSTATKSQDISDDLGNFLVEHETLDARERDRDFFIAIRALSRTLEKPTSERTVEAQYLAKRMQLFLDDRHKGWAARVARLGPGQEPAGWNKVSSAKPFHKYIRETAKEATNNPKKSQGELSLLAAEYRTWIEDLEAKEDQARAKLEQERQQGLANARNDLRELQQRQDQISADMDRANTHSKEEMTQKWSVSRGKELSNIKQAKGLLNNLRAMSPLAGERLEAAIQSMDVTMTQAEQGQWVDVEGASDMAGRLLRDSDQAANKSQKSRDRGRRRKVGGDDYHGTSVGGQIEIKSGYHVDPRYREEILQDVESELSTGENKLILDGWLRQVVR